MAIGIAAGDAAKMIAALIGVFFVLRVGFFNYFF